MKLKKYFLIALLSLTTHFAYSIQLNVGEKYQCFIEDYANKAYDWINISWEIDNDLNVDFSGTYVRTVSFKTYKSGTYSVTAKWTETDMSDPFDPFRHKSHTWYFTCKQTDILVSQIKLVFSQLVMYTNDKYGVLIEGSVLPSNATNKSVTWSSSNPNVATVSNIGLVMPVAEGTATITCKANDGSGVTAKCDIVVLPWKVSKITLNTSSTTLTAGSTKQLTATVEPTDATNKNVTWSSSNTSVATVSSSGLVTAKSAGTATITCKAADGSGKYATCTVTVTDPVEEPNISIVSVTSSNTNLSNLTQNDKLKFSATFKNTGKTATITTILAILDKDAERILYRTDEVNREFPKDQQVTINYEYALTDVPPGDYLATVLYLNKETDMWFWKDQTSLKSITVKESTIPVTKITLNVSSASLSVGETKQLAATISPNNATDKSITWTSSNTSVATVSSMGLVTAKAAGTATITCKANDGSGKSATCTVTVTAVPVVETIDLWISTTVHLNDTKKLTPTITPLEATPKLTWTSSNPSIATVDQQGVVSGKALGTARITVSTDNGKSDYCDIKVVKTFTAQTEEGVTMTFQVLDEAAKTCQAGEDPTYNGSTYTVTSRAVDNKTIGQVTIPNKANGYTVTSIGALAFLNCSSIQAVTIPSSIQSIGNAAFQGCSSIESMIIPNSVTEIEEYAFSKCENLSSIVLPNSITVLNDVLFWKDSSLKTVTIPSSVEKIDWYVFSDSGLEEITIPASVKSIGWYAFQKCSNLKKVTSMILDPTAVWLFDNVFQNEDGTFTSAILYVPSGTKSLYEDLPGWNSFSSIIEMPGIDTDNILSSEGVTIGQGNSAAIDVNLSNKVTDFTAYQFDLTLPSGIELAKNEKGKYMVSKTDRYGDSEQTLQVSLVEGTNTYRIVSFSLANEVIEGTSGSILNITIAAGDNVEPGTYEGQLSDIVFTRADGKQLKLQSAKFNIVVSDITIGDANGDGEVNVSDIVEIVNCIMGKPSAKFVRAAADVNGDSEVNVTDIVQVVNIIMAAGGASSRGMGEMASATTANDRLTLAAVADGGLSLCLDNEDGYVASQFDVQLTEGQALEGITLSSERTANHRLAYTQTGRNRYRVVVYSLVNETFREHSGSLLNFGMKGNGSVTVDNIVFVTDDHQEKHFEAISNTATGIVAIDNPQLTIDNHYDLQGRKTTPTKKGIYVINGKKQIVR